MAAAEIPGLTPKLVRPHGFGRCHFEAAAHHVKAIEN
jgi:hypothetical protein